MDKICSNCETRFTVTHRNPGHQKFCCWDCWYASFKRNKILKHKNKKCRRCGNSFTTEKKLLKLFFCSKECAKLWDKLPKKPRKIHFVKICIGCGKNYLGFGKLFCSIRCQEIDQSRKAIEQSRAKTAAFHLANPLTCKTCGKSFIARFTIKEPCCSEVCARKYSIEQHRKWRWKNEAIVKVFREQLTTKHKKNQYLGNETEYQRNYAWKRQALIKAYKQLQIDKEKDNGTGSNHKRNIRSQTTIVETRTTKTSV